MDSLLLPGAQLLPCPRQWSELLPRPGGRYCTNCKHLVHDFSTAADLPAALAFARAAMPDSQVCGRFAAAQVARPQLRPRLRRFLVALVLVVGLGMSAQEALAQVRQAVKANLPAKEEPAFMGVVVEQMPMYKAGGQAGLQRFLKQTMHYPKGASKQGRIFVKFTVNEYGKASDFEIVKGLEPLLDAEVLRVMRLLGDFIPGKQSGKPVPISFTMPVAFSLE